jgi:acyl-CoA synthetase (AMP-forming)/AMP-acid ligase II
MDQAALSRGLVPVPMHAIDNLESIVSILEDSGAQVLSESHASGEANSAARGRRSGLHQRGILDYSIAFQKIKPTKKI